MSGCTICAVGHESLEIRAVMVKITILRDDAIESDVTLTE